MRQTYGFSHAESPIQLTKKVFRAGAVIIFDPLLVLLTEEGIFMAGPAIAELQRPPQPYDFNLAEEQFQGSPVPRSVIDLSKLPADESNPEEKQHEQEKILKQNRLLTEFDHLLQHRRPDGTYPKEVLDGIFVNLFTAAQEGSMPHAVTETYMPITEVIDPKTQARKRVAKWMGMCAVQVAMSGRRYHFSQPAFDRVDIEVSAAEHNQNIQPGILQNFISPEMSDFDADPEIAKKEHLAGTDSLGSLKAVTDESGTVIGILRQTMLHPSIPLQDWNDMLEDPNNIFGKAISLRDKRSALSVMEVFKQFDLPEEALPEGPITMLEGVVPYIRDKKTKATIIEHLKKAREDQGLLRREAEVMAAEWQEFEVALADSFPKEGENGKPRAAFEIRRFIVTHQDQWDDGMLKLLKSHELPKGEYSMDRELAAALEEAYQHVLKAKGAVATGNEKILAQLAPATRIQLQNDIRNYREATERGASFAASRAMQADIYRTIASQNLKGVGGGCSGNAMNMFGSTRNEDGSSSDIATALMELFGIRTPESSGDAGNQLKSKDGKITINKCRTESCPTRPSQVKVGGCGFCLQRCKGLFNRNIDPTKIPQINPKPKDEAHWFDLEA